MNSRLQCALLGAVCCFFSFVQDAAATTGGLPEEVTILDDNLLIYSRPVPLVSPNGRYVAYVSRGYVCVADIESGKSRRLAEVPGTWTHVFANSGEGDEGGDPDSLSQKMAHAKFNELYKLSKTEIKDFQWTADSTAIVYALTSWDDKEKSTQVRVWRAPLEGEPQQIADGMQLSSTDRGVGGILSRDGKYLVNNSGRHRALIWDVSSNKPRATPFTYLTPSPTSGRWLGIEKDTRQLVIVDEDFNIITRYEEIMPENRYGFDMIWSPDERFAIWREQIGSDWYSNWVGCRYDLKTGERQIFNGDYREEKIAFTGQRGEFVRVGSKGVTRNFSGLDLSENYVGLVPDERIHMRSFWHIRADPPGIESKVPLLRRGPTVTWSPDYELFTIGLPRGTSGESYHLADRKRHLWKLPGDESGTYVSPYNVAGFALDGKSLICYDKSRLFAIPITAIQTPENKVR